MQRNFYSVELYKHSSEIRFIFLYIGWSHRIYGHDTIAILWAWNAVVSGDQGRRFLRVININSTSLFKEVSVISLAYQQSPFDQYYCSKHFSELYKSRKMAPKTSWHRHGTKLRHCHPMNSEQLLLCSIMKSVWFCLGHPVFSDNVPSGQLLACVK